MLQHSGLVLCALQVDLEHDFAEEPLCSSTLGVSPPDHGASALLHGPFIRHSMAKNDMKVCMCVPLHGPKSEMKVCMCVPLHGQE